MGTYATKLLADRAWHKAEAQRDAGKITDARRGRQTFRRYVDEEWLPNHVIEQTTRENYIYLLNRYILPQLGGMRMNTFLPVHLREWIVKLQNEYGAKPPTILKCKMVVNSIFTTALNDQVTAFHPGKGVRTPPVARKILRTITVGQFNAIHAALEDERMKLLVETDIESGLRWGELTELRAKDLDFEAGTVIVSRVVVELKSKDRPGGQRFVVKDYPKDKEWRQLVLAPHLIVKLRAHIARHQLARGDLIFSMPEPEGPARRRRPAVLPDPSTLGRTEPNEMGRSYPHGTLTAYQSGRCRCRHCKDVVAAYRAERRAVGKDNPRPGRRVETDGHIANSWFRTRVWLKALEKADIGFHVTPHGLRHAHASWLLAGGADLQVVKERLGHGSIATTEKYLHALPGADATALKALDAIRGVQGADRPHPAPRDPSMTDEGRLHDQELAELREMVAKMSKFLGG